MPNGIRRPTSEGYDAAAKAAILANVAFGAGVVAGDVYREGIDGVTPADISAARHLGYAVKLLAVIEHDDGEGLESVAVRVHPAMVPLTHPLASVRDSFNAVFVEGDAVGELMFLGRGAGGMPTASAVLGDLLDAAHNLTTGGAGRSVALRRTRVRPIDDLQSAYYLTLRVADRPGVLHAVSGVFGQHRVSIRLMEQEGSPASEESSAAGDAALRPVGTRPTPGLVWSLSPTRPMNATSRPACTIFENWMSSSGSAACCESSAGEHPAGGASSRNTGPICP